MRSVDFAPYISNSAKSFEALFVVNDDVWEEVKRPLSIVGHPVVDMKISGTELAESLVYVDWLGKVTFNDATIERLIEAMAPFKMPELRYPVAAHTIASRGPCRRCSYSRVIVIENARPFEDVALIAKEVVVDGRKFEVFFVREELEWWVEEGLLRMGVHIGYMMEDDKVYRITRCGRGSFVEADIAADAVVIRPYCMGAEWAYSETGVIKIGGQKLDLGRPGLYLVTYRRELPGC